MNDLPQLRFQLFLYPLWNGGWQIYGNRDQKTLVIQLGVIALCVQWASVAKYSVVCISCGDMCELSETSTGLIKQRAWAKGWLITEKEEAFCPYCKDDQKPNPYVKASICRRFGEDQVKELNPNF
jgi:hypothetical protein